MKVLLLGASGQLGRDIQKKMIDYDLSSYTSKDFDFSTNKEFVINEYYDVVINAMGMTDTELCEENPELAYKLNTVRVGEISKVASKMGATLFHISTDYVFDGLKKQPYSELDLPCPSNIYGASKLSGEFHAKMYNHKTFIFRTSSLFGINGNNFIKTMLSKASDGEPLIVVNDQFMSPTHSLDVARAVKRFIDQDIKEYGVYHVSNSGVCSWFEFTQEIMKKAGRKVEVKPVSHTEFPAKIKRPEYSPMTNEKVSKIFRMPNWKDALDEFLVLLGEKK